MYSGEQITPGADPIRPVRETEKHTAGVIIKRGHGSSWVSSVRRDSYGRVEIIIFEHRAFGGMFGVA